MLLEIPEFKKCNECYGEESLCDWCDVAQMHQRDLVAAKRLELSSIKLFICSRCNKSASMRDCLIDHKITIFTLDENKVCRNCMLNISNGLIQEIEYEHYVWVQKVKP